MTAHVRSALPGRTRLLADKLLDRPVLAEQVRELLLREPAVFLVAANPVTGSILVHHAIGLPAEGLLARLRRALTQALEQPPLESATEPRKKDAPLLGPLLGLFQRAGRQRRLLYAAAGLCVLQKTCSIAPSMCIGAAIDIVVRGPGRRLALLGARTALGQLWVLAGINATLWTLESLFEYFQRVLWRHAAHSIQHDLRVEGYAHVQRLGAAYAEDTRTGRLMALLHDDVNLLEAFLGNGADEMVRIATTVVVVTGIFFGVAPVAGLMMVALVPPMFVLSHIVQKRVATRFSAVREDAALVADRLATNLGGLSTILAFTAEDHEKEQIAIAGQRLLASNWHAVVLSSAFIPALRMLVLFGFTSTLMVGGTLALRGQIAAGTFGALVLLTQRLLWTLTQHGDVVDDFQRAMAAFRRIRRLLAERPAIVGGNALARASKGEATIRFERVSFGYSPDVTTIQELSLEIEAGKTTAIVGSTGSGKTTLVKLLLRFCDVGGGVIRLGSDDIRTLDLRSLRSTIGLVSQDVVLFHGTIRENIAYALRDVDMSRVVKAARIAEAHHFIQQLPQGYDTLVGERGQRLSGGQRQRIAIARAVFRDPPVLVFDEATSAVDNETEFAIQRSLEQVAVGRTILLIAHRLSTVRNADRIVVLERGAVTQQGRHDELLQTPGLYRDLWSLQTGERRELRG